ncbi:hypothetical protein ABIE09_000177 [Lysobacter enzymogenes]|uniref:hypothetical protein n=1 Tax=Lysobacter enzymogenes TaxID=69 RepID=UPI00339699F1
MALGNFLKWVGGGLVAIVAALCLLVQGAYWYGASMLPQRLPQPGREYPAAARELLWRTLGGGDAAISARRLNAFSYAGLIFETLFLYLDRHGESMLPAADLGLVEQTSFAVRDALVEIRRARVAAPSSTSTSAGSNAAALQQVSYDYGFESMALFIRASREWPAERMADFVLDSGDYGRDSASLERAAQAYFGVTVEQLTREELAMLVLLRIHLGGRDPHCAPEAFRLAYAEATQGIGDPKLPALSTQTLARLKPIACPPDA